MMWVSRAIQLAAMGSVALALQGVASALTQEAALPDSIERQCGVVASLPSALVDTTQLRAEAPRSCVPRDQCCKVCSKGKACGNSCIRRDYTCRKGSGCACNAAEICR